MKLFVAGLPYDLDDAELMEIFEKFGTVASAKVAMDRETGKSKGFAFVDMPNAEEAKDAIESLKDISLGKKPLVVKEAEERSGPPGGGRPGGGFNKGGGFNSGGGRPGGGFNKGGGGGYGNNRGRY
jgi:cold-inducible RNA-binding protein